MKFTYLLPTLSKDKEKQKTVYYILLSLEIAVLCFIFVNSCLPRTVSSAESGAIEQLLALVFSEDGFLVRNVRKIAHFLEFGALGIFSSLLFLYVAHARRRLHALFAFGLLVGFFDESIQLISGRGASVADVWLDFSGYAVFTLLTLSVMLLKGRKNG